MRPRRLDIAVGAACALLGAGSVAIARGGALEIAANVFLAVALAFYRSRPAEACALAVLATGATVPHDLTISTALLLFANAAGVGRWAGRRVAPVVGLVLLGGALAATALGHDASVPALFVVTTAWAAGWAIRERDVVAQRLADRAAELDREREAFAQLSVRYERARIASELHDIVAHAISVMVVQAGAGQRLAAIDRKLTAETFQAIAGAARQGERDMGALVTLLSDEEAIAASPDLTLIEELITRASGTGLDVTLRLEGSREGLPAAAVQTAYRVVRESLTNALRYASGAPVRVAVRGQADELVVEVINDPAPGNTSLTGHGTGNGLRGLHERVSACGGRLDAGPLPDGGWRVAASLPRRMAPIGQRPAPLMPLQQTP